MKKNLTKTNKTNNRVDYSIEEADAALDDMIETTLAEFDAACDEIDAEYDLPDPQDIDPGDCMSIEEAKRLTLEAVRKIYEQNDQ